MQRGEEEEAERLYEEAVGERPVAENKAAEKNP